MKDSVFYTAIVIIIFIAGVLFWLGSAQGNKTNTNNTPNIDEATVIANEILTKTFNANANIKMQDITLNADVNRTSPNSITLAIIEPTTLEGMNLQYNGEEISINYKGMTLGLDKNSKGLSSVASILMKSIETATAGTGLEIKSENNSIIVNGATDTGDFSIQLDPSNNSIATIKAPDLDFSCEFSPIF